MKETNIRRNRAYRRRRSRRKSLIKTIINRVVVLCLVTLVILAVYGVYRFANKMLSSSGKKDNKKSDFKVELANLDGNDTEWIKDERKDEPLTEPATEPVTEPSTEAIIEVPTQNDENPTIEIPDVRGEYVYIYGNSTGVLERAESYSNEPYSGTVKEGFTPLSQIYRIPSVEQFVDDGFYNNTLFVGDSITTGITIYANSYKYNMPANVLADKGYTIGKIMMRKDEIIDFNPARIFILVGSNDLNSQNPNIEYIAERYLKAVAELKDALPNAKIYIILTLPINTKYEQKASIRNAKITEFDKQVVKLCNEQGVYYIDMATSLKGADGMLREELTSDGLHLKGEYYPYWYNLIEDIIKVNE